MPIVRRYLTVNFQKSVKVTSSGVVPQTVEVTIVPLQDASNADVIATYVGSPQTATVTLNDDDNQIIFELVPSYFPGLSNPINYRIMWRVGGVTGRTETYDFSMPDADIRFDELQSTGYIIDGEAYLQQSDLGTPGRVAKLNDNGKVVDSDGNPVATQVDIAGVQANLNSSVSELRQEATSQRQELEQAIEYNSETLSSSLNTSLQQAVRGWSNNLREERTTRSNAINALTTTLTSLSNTVSANNTSFSGSISLINQTLVTKADLDTNGRIPISQIPPEAITNWIPLSSASARLSLQYPEDIQLGDVVLTPTGLYGLTGTTPSNPSSWYLLNQVLSVNGKIGAVSLNASDVGAIATNATIPQSQIENLSSTIGGLATILTATQLQQQINNIVNDSSIVRLNSAGYVNHSLLDDSVAYVNVLNQITKKDGTVISDPSDRGVISINGRYGVVTLTAADVGAIATNATIPQSQVGSLVAALAAKADLSSGKVILSQIPSIPQSLVTGLTDSLAAKANLVNGTVPLAQLPSIPSSQVTGLATIISGNGLDGASNAIGRITSLEGRVSSLEVSGGGGGTGTGTITTSVYWSGLSSDDILDLNTITLGSPFGLYTSGPNAGSYYYNKNGVPSSDAVFPVITPNGRLKLYKRNESGPAEPVYALASELKTTSDAVVALGTTVSNKVNQTDFAPVATKVNQFTTSKADLDSSTNTLVASQIPFSVKPNPKIVSSLAAMTALTTSQVHAGDICIVSGQGTYTLLGNTPSQINNTTGWAQHFVPTGGTATGTVKSVNTKTPDTNGNVTLQAADIGALPTGSLSNYVTSETLAQQIATRATVDDAYNAIGSSQLVRGRVDYAVRAFTIGATSYCTSGVPISNGAPFGSPVIDKDANSNNTVSAPNNALVLLTNQADDRYNGVWKVNTQGPWTRPTSNDSVAGTAWANTKVFPGTLVIVNNSSALGGIGTLTGSTNFTVWQNRWPVAAVIDSTVAGINASTRWSNLGNIAPVSLSGSGGISITGQYPNLSVGPTPLGQGGGDGELAFVRRFSTTVTPTSALYTVTHGLNTRYPQVTVIDDLSASAVLVGWKVGPPNSTTGRYDTVILEFNSATYSNPYRISVVG